MKQEKKQILNSQKRPNLRKNSRGVFGLNTIQEFFVVLLGVALLAYVIVVIMGALQSSSVLPSLSGSNVNESDNTLGVVYINQTPYTLANSSVLGFTSPSINAIWGAYNQSNGSANTNGTGTVIDMYNITIGLGNASLTSTGLLNNATSQVWPNVSISYTFGYNSFSQNQTNAILGTVSVGIISFFSAINPVYAILAVLVIILVLVVLVKVVRAPTGGQAASVQL
jgi:uncharacterized membrane protein